MPTLSNAKHERFAQEVAAGKNPTDAYEMAGFKRNTGNASTLKSNKAVQSRIAELLQHKEEALLRTSERAIEKTALTKEWVIDRLIDNHDRASLAENQGSVVNRSLELLGKEMGMFIDRKEIRSGPLDAKSDDELDAIIRGAAAEAKISLGTEGKGTATKH